MYPVSYVNDPTVIMQNYKMVSINSCIQVDLMGQICSESIGMKQISGVGGQIDFVRGASMAQDGKSIIAIPSTAAKGKTLKQRAKELINIAHPDFREGLIKEYENRFKCKF